jgi:hypothetical protein
MPEIVAWEEHLEILCGLQILERIAAQEDGKRRQEVRCWYWIVGPLNETLDYSAGITIRAAGP